MKKRLMCFLIISLLGMSVLACGKSQEEIVADNLQDELELDKEDAQELAADIVEIQNDVENSESSESNEEIEVAAVEDEIIYAEPTQEILDANFEDFKVQVDSTVFHFDYDMTAQDFISQFDENDFKFMYDNTSDVINMDKLVSPDNLIGEMMDVYFKDDLCFSLRFTNENMEKKTITLKECSFTEITFNPNFSGAIYFAKGIPFNNFAMLDENENFTFNNLRSYFESIGVTEYKGLDSGKTYFYTQNGDMEYIVTPVSMYGRASTSGSGWHTYCSYILTFRISPDTAKVNDIRFTIRAQGQYE